MIADLEGIHFARSIRMIPLEKRWGRDCLGWMVWAPWHMYKGASDADGDVPEEVPVEEGGSSGSSGGQKIIFI